MSDYTDAAPNVSKLRSEAEFRSDFPASAPPAPPAPEPKAARKAALYAAFRAEYNGNGGAVDLAKLARDQGVPIKWCRILMREVVAGKASVYAAEPK